MRRDDILEVLILKASAAEFRCWLRDVLAGKTFTHEGVQFRWGSLLPMAEGQELENILTAHPCDTPAVHIPAVRLRLAPVPGGRIADLTIKHHGGNPFVAEFLRQLDAYDLVAPPKLTPPSASEPKSASTDTHSAPLAGLQDPRDRDMVRLWNEGYIDREITSRLEGLYPQRPMARKSVQNRIHDLRKILGPEVVKYHRAKPG